MANRKQGMSPAPWKVVEPRTSARRRVYVADANGCSIVCVPVSYPKRRREFMLDATLMSLAPTMLSILQRLVAYDYKGDVVGVMPYDGCREEILGVLKEMEKADEWN